MLRDDAIRVGLIDATEEDTKRMNLGPADFAAIKERKAANAAVTPNVPVPPAPAGALDQADKTAKHGK